MNNSEVLSFTGEVSTTVNLERREHANVRLLITTHADNKHLFDRKATNKDACEKIAEQFTKASGFSVKRRRGTCKRMGLVANGTLSSQTEIPRVPNSNFPNFFVNGKHPLSSKWRWRRLIRWYTLCGCFNFGAVFSNLCVLFLYSLITSTKVSSSKYIYSRVLTIN